MRSDNEASKPGSKAFSLATDEGETNEMFKSPIDCLSEILRSGGISLGQIRKDLQEIPFGLVRNENLRPRQLFRLTRLAQEILKIPL